MTETVLEQGVTDAASDWEDDGNANPNLKTAKVIATDWELEPEQVVVEERDWECCRNAIVREHVREHTKLVVDRCRAPYEGPELRTAGRVWLRAGASWWYKVVLNTQTDAQLMRKDRWSARTTMERGSAASWSFVRDTAVAVRDDIRRCMRDRAYDVES